MNKNNNYSNNNNFANNCLNLIEKNNEIERQQMLLEQQQSSYNLNIDNYSNDNNNDNNKINILEIIDSSRIDEPINSENINNNLNNEEEQEEPMTFNPSKSIKQQMNKEYENEKEIISKSSFSHFLIIILMNVKLLLEVLEMVYMKNMKIYQTNIIILNKLKICQIKMKLKY